MVQALVRLNWLRPHVYILHTYLSYGKHFGCSDSNNQFFTYLDQIMKCHERSLGKISFQAINNTYCKARPELPLFTSI